MNIQYPTPRPAGYAELHALSNFSFLRGASDPAELIDRAHELGYAALALTDECSFAGVVRAHVRVRELTATARRTAPEGVEKPVHNPVHGPVRGFVDDDPQARPRTGSKAAPSRPAPRLVVGTELDLGDGCRLVALATDERSWRALCALITAARRAAPEGRLRDRRRGDRVGGARRLGAPARAAGDSPAAREAVEHRFGWTPLALPPRLDRAGAARRPPRREAPACGSRRWALRYGLLARRRRGRAHARGARAAGLQDVMTCIRHGLHARGRGAAPASRTANATSDGLDALGAGLSRRTRSSARSRSPRSAASISTLLDYRYPREVVPAGH